MLGSLLVVKLVLLDNLARLCISIERHDPKIRCPAFKFSDPVSDGRVRNNDQDRAGRVGKFEPFHNLPDECDDLNSFSLYALVSHRVTHLLPLTY